MSDVIFNLFVNFCLCQDAFIGFRVGVVSSNVDEVAGFGPLDFDHSVLLVFLGSCCVLKTGMKVMASGEDLNLVQFFSEKNSE